MRPRLLDLFCGAGGAAMGYHRAGFDVVGVDINPQPHYPFEFHQGDAMTWPLDGFDAIHASPPCQGYSRMRHLPWIKDKVYPLLIDGTRARLHAAGIPFVIENVEDAPLDPSIVLCGAMFGLPLYRHRRFELSHWLMAPGHPRHQHVIYSGRRDLANRYRQGGGRDVTGVFNDATNEEAMGIDWMTKAELSQAIPPVYTEHIGRQLLAYVNTSAA
jgi:DNA (cytosine-5)-methyltransferase 1